MEQVTDIEYILADIGIVLLMVSFVLKEMAANYNGKIPFWVKDQKKKDVIFYI